MNLNVTSITNVLVCKKTQKTDDYGALRGGGGVATSHTFS